MRVNSLKVLLVPVAVLALLGCSDGNDGNVIGAGIVSYDAQGPYAVGNRTISVVNASEGRVLDVELWYPASTAGPPQSILDFAIDEQQRDELETLLVDVPATCTRRDTFSSAAPEPVASPEKLPLVIFSHCFQCMRFSAFTLAERLASHGIAVAAPDHTMDTLFNPGAMLTSEFLAVRASDVRAVLDELLIANSPALPLSLQGRFDESRVGVAGHSFGAVTAGKVLQDDARFKAGLIIAAPVQNPLLPGVSVGNIAEPTLYLVAREDNSITELGNAVMRANFNTAASPAWKVEVADAGHWSFSDIAGIVPAFDAGCGSGVRQTIPGEPFTYLDNTVAREISAAYGVRFFAGSLLGDETALRALAVSTQPGIVEIEAK